MAIIIEEAEALDDRHRKCQYSAVNMLEREVPLYCVYSKREHGFLR